MSTQTQTQTQTRPRRSRLIVELAQRPAAELDELTAIEGANKTTVVNRAIQVMRFLRDAEARGEHVELVNKDGVRTRVSILA